MRTEKTPRDMNRPTRSRRACVSALCLVMLSATPGSTQATDALFELLCGRSVHFYDGSGNQIEYTAGDGTAYLWFHDQPDVIVGTWGVYSDAEVEQRQADGSGDEGRDGGLRAEDFLGAPTLGAQVCYEYGPGAFSALDPGGFHCFGESELFETVVNGGVFPGDRYGLRDGEPPYTLREHPFQPLESFDADFPQLPPEPACGLPMS